MNGTHVPTVKAMKISPLLLERYFASDLHFTANRQFNTEKPVEITDAQYSVQANALRNKEEAKQWQITLQIKYQPAALANAPYSFSLEIIGFFKVAGGFPEEKTEQLVQTNGATILYGIAREIVRDVTARGPHPAMMLPSVSFFEPAKKAPPPAAIAQPDTSGPGQPPNSQG